MELDIVKRGLDFSRRKKKWLIVLGLVGLSSYGAYRVYNMPSVVRRRKRIVKLLGAIISVAEMVSDSAETVGVLSRDLKEFLLSDSDEIPNSLKQLSKISRSEEFVQSVIRVTEAMTVGIVRGYQLQNRGEIEDMEKSTFTDKVMEKLMSSAGTGFVSVVVGSFARNLVLGFYMSGQPQDGLNGNGHSGVSYVKSNTSSLSGWVDVMCDEKCKVLIADCIQTFVSTAIAVYLDKTMDINVYDEMFKGLTNPKHQTQVRDILVALCNGAVATLVRTSHQVLTSSKSKTELSSKSYSIVDQDEAWTAPNKEVSGEVFSGKASGCKDLQNNGWVSSVSSALAVPSNTRFLLDVTGRVTLETIRSLVEFFWRKITECLKRSLNVIHEEVVERGLEIVRYVGARSSAIVTICFMFFLHVLGSTQTLLPA